MIPLRVPDLVPAFLPGLLQEGLPVRFLRAGPAWHGPTGVITKVYEGAITARVASYGGRGEGEGEVRIVKLALSWGHSLAPYAALHWLADRGHCATWMLPTTHGGRIVAGEALSAWEVSTILVARSVLQVATGWTPVADLLLPIQADGDTQWRPSSRAPSRGLEESWHVCGRGWSVRSHKGPETGDAGIAAAQAAALADNCALVVPGGILLAPVAGVPKRTAG